MSRQGTVEERIRKVVSQALCIDIEKVVDTAHLADDLKADSLDTVEVTMELEEEFGIELPDVEAGKINTVAELIGYVKANGAA